MARDADDGDVELLAMVCRQGLQGFQGVVHHDEGGAREVFFGEALHHESTQTFVIQVFDVLMAIVAYARQGEKQGLSGIHEMTAVDEQVADAQSVEGSYELPAYDVCNLF